MDSNVTDLRTRSRYQPDFGALARNRIVASRTSMSLSEREFARMLTSLLGREVTAGHVASWEDSVTPPGDVLIAATSVSPVASSKLGIRSHKFIALHINPDYASHFISTSASDDIPDVSNYQPIEYAINDNCTMYVWPYGSVVLHLTEEMEFPDITTLAFWRYESYGKNMLWASEQVHKITGAEVEASYVLSMYWVHTPVWAGRILESALKIICAPRVLLERDRNSGDAERELLAEGFEHEEMRSFGVQGVSSGYASWSGVVYHPFDTHRALSEADIVSAELDAQAIWTYCAYIAESIEKGQEPNIPEGYGCNFLRASRSRLLTPRPQESGAHRSMRDAIVETSGLPIHLSHAIDTLKDLEQK